MRQWRWPRVQVRVISSIEEITAYDDGQAQGYLHAELEYWLQVERYQIQKKFDLAQRAYLPAALWMAVPPHQPEQPVILGSLFFRLLRLGLALGLLVFLCWQRG